MNRNLIGAAIILVLIVAVSQSITFYLTYWFFQRDALDFFAVILIWGFSLLCTVLGSMLSRISGSRLNS